MNPDPHCSPRSRSGYREEAQSWAQVTTEPAFPREKQVPGPDGSFVLSLSDFYIQSGMSCVCVNQNLSVPKRSWVCVYVCVWGGGGASGLRVLREDGPVPSATHQCADSLDNTLWFLELENLGLHVL